MDSTNLPSEPEETSGLDSLRNVIPLIFVVVCGVVVWKFGALVLVLGGGFLAALIQLPVALYKGVLTPVVRGVQCPTCGVWGLERVACVSFGNRFYRCGFCGRRCKRTDHDSPWFDASGKEDDDMYEPIPVHGPNRRREALVNGLKGLGVWAAFFSSCAAPSLIGGVPGAIISSTLLALVIFSVCRAGEKDTLKTPSSLWDSEIDA
jgi:hypothetical protein